MDRQGRGGPPHGHRRQSSLPPSLHRWIVPDPSQPRRSTTQEGVRGAPAPPEEQEDPWTDAPAPLAHPIASAPASQRLPSLILTQAVFDESADSGEPAEGWQQSPSPGPGAVVSQGAASIATSALALPIPPAPGTVVRSDPVYYASIPGYPHTYTVPPPGPPLPPILWNPSEGARGPSTHGAPSVGQDRSDPPPNFPSNPPSPRNASPPSQPDAGPSRLPEEPQASPVRRRRRQPKSQSVGQPQEAASASGSQPIDIPRRGSGHGTRGESFLYGPSFNV